MMKRAIPYISRMTLQVTGLHRNFDEFWLGHFIWGNPELHK